VREGEIVPVGTVLTHIYAAREAAAEKGSAATAPDREDRPARVSPLARKMAEQAGIDVAAVAAGRTGRVMAQDVRAARAFSSPRARKRARELGVAWQSLTGSGPAGRVVERDVLAALPHVTQPLAAASDVTPPPNVEWQTPTPVQRITAERMAASFTTAPHFYLTVEVVADALLAARERLLPIVERKAGVKLTVTDLLVRVCAVALTEHPRANAFWQDGRIGINTRMNVGIAASSDSGLLVPVLVDADRKLLAQIAAERADLVERARAGKLAPDDLSGGTFTLTNLGMYRVDAFQAVLNPPQSCILAVGRIAERPVALDGQLTVRRTAVLTLSCDHRVLDGAVAAAFLGRVAELIEEPYGLLA
jgi:pyruvate dehydrogenase E2 component (dihydrolipoamide acetyltransferase)